MITVIAEIEVAEGKRDAFLAEFQRIIPAVRGEVGCIEYGPTLDAVTDIGAQITHRPNMVTIVEKWESVATLKAHLVAPHMIEYRPRVKEIVKGTTLRILDHVETAG